MLWSLAVLPSFVQLALYVLWTLPGSIISQKRGRWGHTASSPPEKGVSKVELPLEVVQSLPLYFSSLLTDTLLSNTGSPSAAGGSLAGMQFLATTLFCFCILFFPVSCVFSLLKPRVMYVCYCFVRTFSARSNGAPLFIGP